MEALGWLVWVAAAVVVVAICAVVFSGPTADPWDDDDYR